jgi:hypothetical protein
LEGLTVNIVQQFLAARRAGTPLVAISTPDPAATIDQLRNEAIADTTPVVLWDAVQGWRAGNKAAVEAIREVMRALAQEAQAAGLGDGSAPAPKDVTQNPVECMTLALRLPEKSVLFAVNAHRYLADTTANGAVYVQAVWNLRDEFKRDLRTLVLLGPSVVLPPELSGDVLPLDEALPGEDELRTIVSTLLAENEATGDVERAVDALRGLAAFSAEQATVMAIEPTSVNGKATRAVNPDSLWERKRQMIAATPGLSVWQGGETFGDVGGNEQVKSYLRRILAGRDAPRVVVFFDEIEKGMAGAAGGGGPGDSSGVSQGMHGQMLTYMQDYKVEGVLELGPPGSGKSAVAKAVGATAGIPTISVDLGGMKASLVGESEARLRTALKVITAVGGGRALFIATCNRISTLSPELRRRFQRVFFFDLPDAEERDVIWRLYARKYDLGDQQRPDDAGWTGAEIEQAARLAYRLGIPLLETAQYIVPVSKSAEREITDLRASADRRFLSASKPGPYIVAESQPFEVVVAGGPRKRALGKEGLN